MGYGPYKKKKKKTPVSETSAWRCLSPPLTSQACWYIFFFLTPTHPKKQYVSPSPEWVTGIMIQANWAVESPCDCLFHFLLLLINSNAPSDFVNHTFLSLIHQSPCKTQPIKFFQAHFTVRTCAFWVGAGTLWTLTMEYLLTRSVIMVLVWLQLIAQAVSGAVAQQSHSCNLAKTKIALNPRNYLQSLAAPSPLFILSACHVFSHSELLKVYVET